MLGNAVRKELLTLQGEAAHGLLGGEQAKDRSKRVYELRQVFQARDYKSAFDLEAPGFNPQWWGNRLKRLAEVRADTFIVLDGDEEVARAEVEPEYVLRGHYVGFEHPGLL